MGSISTAAAMDVNEEINVKKFVAACGYNSNIETVRDLLPIVNINARHKNGRTALYTAMLCNNIEIVRLLLASPRIHLDTTVFSATGLHAACQNNNLECVELFLSHPRCTRDIVRMEDRDGNTAEMLASQHGHVECAEIVHDYLLDVAGVMQRVDRMDTGPDRLQRLSRSQLVQEIARLESDEALFRQRTDTKDRELEEVIHELESKLNVAREEQQRHKILTASDLADIQNKKKDLETELKQRPQTFQPREKGETSSPPSISAAPYAPSAPSAPSASSAPPPSGPSVIPVCPGCRKEMWPPVEIYNCSNGHLICSVCKPKVYMNQCTNNCGTFYTGRAFAMEQMIRQILGI